MIRKTAATLVACSALALISCSSGSDSGSGSGAPTPDPTAGDAPAGVYRISVTNLTTGQPMTPPVVALHDAGAHLFQIGEAASLELQEIAENGNNDPMVALAGSLAAVSAAGVAFADPDEPGPFGPGETASITLETASPNQVLSIANMIVCTNDGFTGTDSQALPTGEEPLVFEALPYDAGTEVNTLNADYWVPPCGGSGDNLHEDENGVTAAHPGQSGVDAFDFDGAAPAIRVEVELVEAIAPAGLFRVSVTNLTTGQPMTPPVVALHDAGTHLFQIGEAASAELQAIAENGNNDPMVALAGSLDTVSAAGVAFANPAAPGPFGPGETATVTLATNSARQVLSLVNMVVCTNDGFSGTDSTALPTGNEPLVFEALPYDAGTEVNTLDADYWVPPCGGSGANLHEDENGVTAAHPGQTGVGDFDFDGTAPVLRIEVERVEPIAGTYEIAFTNLSTGQPMTPPVAAIHEGSVTLFSIGSEASVQLRQIAENGNNDPMVALAGSLAEVSAAGVGFVDAENPGPMQPGETATLTLETDADTGVFSAVSMVVCTNDGFTGTNSHALPTGSETLSFEVVPYDAGTEVNTLDADYWVPPCGGSGANLHEDEGGVTGPHPGQTGTGNFDFVGSDAIMRIEITRQ
jgi:Ser/Thr protein kinase RdoA (MazF antagonist)